MPSRSVSPESATRAIKQSKVEPVTTIITTKKRETVMGGKSAPKVAPSAGDGGIKKAGEEFNLVDLQNLEHHFFRISSLCLGIIFLMAVIGQIIVHVNIRS